MSQASKSLLSDRLHTLLGEEREVLDQLYTRLTGFGATTDEATLLRRALTGLTELFLLVVVGEFNAGKSAFINALLGDAVMPEGVTPTTAAINFLRFGPVHATSANAAGFVEHTYPAPFLRDIHIVDTPGTNAIQREHEALTQTFVPRADLVLFVTSADRPFTETERAFMQEIREWGKKIVVVINKSDLVDRTGLAQIERFVRDNATKLLGFAPEIFPVSARLALAAKQADPGDTRAELWHRAGFEQLEEFVFRTLDEVSRVRLKLLSPLGIAERLTERYFQVAAERLRVLAGDTATIERIDSQLALHGEEMHRDFQLYVTKIERIVLAMNARGAQFFDEMLRIGRVLDLLNADKVRAAFEREVTRDTEAEVEQTVQEVIDWLIERDLKSWTAVRDFVARRQLTRYDEDIVGEVGRGFEYDRRALLASVGREARDVVAAFDPAAEARRLSESVRAAVVSTGMAQAGAIGLGAIVVAAASSVLVDITGLLAASLLAVIGFGILPAKRRRARAEFEERSAALRDRLLASLTEQFTAELERSQARLRDVVAPYTRFVRGERDSARRMQDDLANTAVKLRQLRVEIGRRLSDPAANEERGAIVTNAPPALS